MKCIAAFFVLACLNFNINAQVELESLAKSEMANYYQLKKYGSKRTSGDNIDIVYAGLSLAPNMKTAYLKGDVNYFFKTTGPVNLMNFDLRNSLTVDSIIFKGQKMSFTHSNTHILTITLNPLLPSNTLDSIRIYYQGFPDVNANSRAYARNVTISGPVITTLSEPYGAHFWWPCRENLSDKIDSLDVRVTVDTLYKVASNGVLKSITTNDTVHTYYWEHHYPVATYLVAFAASRYSIYSDSALLQNGKRLEILNYVFPHSEADARVKTKELIPVMQLYDSLFGAYPFYKEKYGHAQFTVGGGMEHQTMSFVGSFGFDLLAHELAHQWFGDKITCGSWHDLWLNESFATYCNLLCYDFLRPRNEWLDQLKNNKKDVLAQPDGSVRAKDTVNQGALFEFRTTYQKGAMVLNQLRWVIGDKAFFSGIKNYMASNQLSYNFARENDLKFYLEQSSGQSLTDYFNDWITGEGYPLYTIKWIQNGSKVTIDIIQTQSHPSVELYNVPLPILLKGQSKDTLLRLPISKAIEHFEITLPLIVKELVFDPDEWILGKSTIIFPKSKVVESFTIYPNPSKSIFYISLDNSDLLEWQLIDKTGRTVLTKKYADKLLKGTIESLNLEALASGSYTILLQSSDKIIPKSIIVY